MKKILIFCIVVNLNIYSNDITGFLNLFKEIDKVLKKWSIQEKLNLEYTKQTKQRLKTEINSLKEIHTKLMDKKYNLENWEKLKPIILAFETKIETRIKILESLV